MLSCVCQGQPAQNSANPAKNQRPLQRLLNSKPISDFGETLSCKDGGQRESLNKKSYASTNPRFLLSWCHFKKDFSLIEKVNASVKYVIDGCSGLCNCTYCCERGCDEWGGAESRGNGARPVEWMIMNDTCATHRSRVPRRSSGRNKRRSDNSGRRERTRPGFYFVFCVRGSRPRGAAAFHLSLFILLLKLLNVRRFPPPSSRTYQLHYSGISNSHSLNLILSSLSLFLQRVNVWMLVFMCRLVYMS